VDSIIDEPDHSVKAGDWFEARMNRAFQEVEDQFKKYRISDALMIVYKLFWDEFSSWYLEAIKPAYQAPIDEKTYKRTIGFIDQLLHMLHPFMPFITEEIWQLISERETGESLMVSPMPAPQHYDNKLLGQFEDLKEVVTQVRSIRKDKNISPRELLELLVRTSENGNYEESLQSVIKKLANLSKVIQVTEDPGDTISFIVKNVEYFVPVGNMVDAVEEIAKLQSELEYTEGFMQSVKKKLSNERFVQNAPAQVVAKERQKLDDAEVKAGVLKAQIEKLKAQA
jgi:valyl-tRNA synthetase